MNPGRPLDALFVENNPEDVRLLEEAFKTAGFTKNVHVVTTADEARDFLHRRGEFSVASLPSIVLLDLNLPEEHGFELLKEMKESEELRTIPVIALSGSDYEKDVERGYGEHANAYVVKPAGAEEFAELARDLTEFWLKIAELPRERSEE